VRALVTGAGGQLGVELLRTAPPGFQITGLKHSECDIADQAAVDTAFAQINPDVVVNAAAYNAVDDAEKNSKTAYAANATGPGNLARAAARAGARIIHVSTDYVFDGASNQPYKPNDATNPLNTYGKSKLAGEHEVLQSAADHLIIRTSWLFSAHGRNFLQIILSEMKAGRTVRAINDQVSVPTACRGLAQVIWLCAPRGGPTGIAHWVDKGTATRYDQAVAIREMALERQIIASADPIKGVSISSFPSAAVRPRYSVMDGSALSRQIGKQQRAWQDWLREILDEIPLNKSIAPGGRD
jgi:dTDP-4-dehydrorhamnose reductase